MELQVTVRSTRMKKYGRHLRRPCRSIYSSIWAPFTRRRGMATNCTLSALNCVYSNSPRWGKHFQMLIVTNWSNHWFGLDLKGEAQPSSIDYASELLDSISGSQESPIQSLRAVPFFDPLTPSDDEEKVRVSVHNYTRALKRNRGTSHSFLGAIQLRRNVTLCGMFPSETRGFCGRIATEKSPSWRVALEAEKEAIKLSVD